MQCIRILSESEESLQAQLKTAKRKISALQKENDSLLKEKNITKDLMHKAVVWEKEVAEYRHILRVKEKALSSTKVGLEDMTTKLRDTQEREKILKAKLAESEAKVRTMVNQISKCRALVERLTKEREVLDTKEAERRAVKNRLVRVYVMAKLSGCMFPPVCFSFQNSCEHHSLIMPLQRKLMAGPSL